MRWKRVRADEFCEAVRDGTHDTPKRTETGYKLVTGKHIKDGQINPSDAYYISERDYKKINKRSVVEQWDVVMSMIGTVGEVSIVKEQPNYAIKNIALFKCAGSELKGKWLSYYLKSPDAQGYMSGGQKGSSQQFLSLKQLRSLPVPITDELYMRKVVNILSAYDDLIENNRERIKLLEELARRLYKEWFVDLHFPGWETTPLENGIPKGWSTGALGDIAVDVGRNRGKEKRSNYTYYLPIECLPKKSLAYTCTKDISLAESSLVAFRPNDILFGAMRPYFHKVVIARDTGLTRSTCFVINAKEASYWSYLVLLLFSEDTVNYATRISVGTTMPYTRWKDFIQMPAIIPSVDVVTEFGKLFFPIANKIRNLAEQSIRLTEARDRLLPKLMSGELEV